MDRKESEQIPSWDFSGFSWIFYAGLNEILGGFFCFHLRFDLSEGQVNDYLPQSFHPSYKLLTRY